MTQIFGITAPIFMLIALGFASVRYQTLNKEHMRGMGSFVMKIALPMMIFVNLLGKSIGEIWQPQYLLVYGTASLVTFFITLWLYRRRFREPLSQASVMAFGATMSNTGFIGFGLLGMIIGSQAAIYFSMTSLIEGLIVIPLTLILAELGRQHGAQSDKTLRQIVSATLLDVVKSPIVIALFGGLLFAAFDIRLPATIERTMGLLAACAAPLAIFVIGGNLYGTNIQAAGKHALLLSAMKLVFMPLLVFGLFYLMPGVSREMHYAGTLLAAVSMATLFNILGMGYGLGERSAAVLLITTMLMFVSVSTVLWLWLHTTI